MRLLHKLALSALLLSGQVWAKHWHEDQDDWNWHRQHYHDEERDEHKPSKDCYFDPHDVRLISQYYAPRYRPLPPGLQKKFHRSATLPSGWETRMDLLPAALERLLSPVPAESRRGIIDGFAVVYSPQTGVILDAVALFGGQ